MEQIVKIYARYEHIAIEDISKIPLEIFRGYDGIVDGPYYLCVQDKDIE